MVGWYHSGMEQLLNLLLLALELLLPAPAVAPTAPPPLASSTLATVVRVIDGDTIVVAYEGGEEVVRYIGIDAPEQYRNQSPECYANDAAAANAALVRGQTVRLVPDVELQDKYGRALRYVYVGETFVNQALIESGHARTLPIPPNRTHARELYAEQEAARAAGRGLWSACE